MSDIFISYSREDTPRARSLAVALEQHGWSVWWDRNIPPGESFDAVIEEALDSARCIVVLWSEESVKSDWVKTEASEGVKRRILVPALIEDVKIPLEFRRIQAANLSDWQGTDPHPEFEEFLQAVTQKLSGSSAKRAKSTRVSALRQSAESSQKSSLVKKQWSAELLERTYWTKRVFRIRLDHEAHLLEYINGWSVQEIKVDGKTVSKGGTAVTFRESFSFAVTDGDVTRKATIQVKHNYLTARIVEFRLIVARRTLFTEGAG